MATDSKIRQFARRVRSLFVGTQASWGSLQGVNQVDFGVTVTDDTALKFTAVYAAIKIIAENIAALPKSVKKRTPDGYRDAVDHAAYKLINVQPNEYTDVFTFWFTIIAWMEGKQGAFAKIDWEGGLPVALHQIDPDYVRVSLVDGRKMYYVSHPDPDFAFLNGIYHDFEMLHFFIFTKNGIEGIDPITYNSAAIGRGIATQKFSADFYSRGGNIRGTLETDGSLGDEAYEQFMAHFNKAARNFETPLLEYGIKYKPIGITPVAAQLIQSETMSIQDIARIFSIPPHLLAELSHATFSNIEQQNIFFSIFSLRPVCKRIEQQLEAKLFTSRERGRYSVKFDLRGMMRGDDGARAAYYQSGIVNGWMTPNEARELEGMRRLPGLDRPRVSLNYNEVDEDGNIVENKKNNQESE